MKKQIIAKILFCLCACFLGASAQNEYLPIFEKGKRWECLVGDYLYGKENAQKFTEIVVGDTIINDTIAVKVRRDNQYRSTYQYWHESNGKVYFFSQKCQCFLLYMDFNFKEGNNLYWRNGVPRNFPIYKEQSIVSNGVSRRLLHLKSQADKYQSYWIEGVGSFFHTDYINEEDHEANSERYWITACYDKDGECIFSEDWLKQYSGIGEIAADRPEAVGEQRPVIYDLYGRMVTQPQRGAVYIINGQKTVWQ